MPFIRCVDLDMFFVGAWGADFYSSYAFSLFDTIVLTF